MTTKLGTDKHFAKPLPMRLGTDRVSNSTGMSKDTALVNVLHLLWHRQLSTNLEKPLSMDSEVGP
jgi:hypothetical protein